MTGVQTCALPISDGVVLVRAETLWVFVSRKAHALGRVPPELAAAFPVVADV